MRLDDRTTLFPLQDSRHSMRSLLNEYKSNVGHKEAVIIDPHVANIVKGVSALTAAFRLVQLGQCTGNQDASCLRQLRADKLHEAILGNLKKLSFTTMGSGQARDTSPNHHFFTPDGSLVSTQRLVYIIDRDDGLQRVRIVRHIFSKNISINTFLSVLTRNRMMAFNLRLYFLSK